MSILTRQISKYLEYCQYQKRLDEKTLKAYRIDLRQFSEQLPSTDIPDISQCCCFWRSWFIERIGICELERIITRLCR